MVVGTEVEDLCCRLVVGRRQIAFWRVNRILYSLYGNTIAKDTQHQRRLEKYYVVMNFTTEDE